MAVNLQGIRRNIRNVVHNYTDAQVKVREATSNDPWGPSSTVMSEIADLTYNVSAFSEIMQMVWKRLNDHGKNWRHVYKALVLLEYLIKTGSEKVAQQCKENIYAIQTLKDFQYLDDNKDQGINVREKAKALVALLKDEDRLKNERIRALKAKERFAQSTASVGSNTMLNGVRERFDGQQRHDMVSSGESPTNFDLSASELEAARPQTAGEEELQLQLALAMSREEQEQEETKTKSDDMRLQLALQKSKEVAVKDTERKQPAARPSNDLLDLVDLNFGNPQAAAAAAAAAAASASAAEQQQPPPPQRTSASTLDPWGMSMPSSKASDDSFGGGHRSQNDPWATIPAAAASRQKSSPGLAAAGDMNPYNDPWVSSVRSDSVLQNQDAFTMPASQSPREANNDPWTNQENNSGSGANVDPFSPIAQEELAQFDLLRDQMEQRPSNHKGPSSSPNPFDLGDLHSGLLGAESGRLGTGAAGRPDVVASMAQTGAKPKKIGGVQSILGEHSNLVNLDELVSSGGAQTVRNPFEQQQQNPFQTTKAQKPAMNELLQQKNFSGWNQAPQGSSKNQSDINPFF